MSTYEHRDNQDRNRSSNEDGNNTQLFIAKGRNHGMNSQSLADLISAETSIDQSLIENIKILDDFSFFAVPNSEAGRILDHFQAKAGEGRPLVSKAKRKASGGGGDRRGGFGGGGYRNDRNNDRRDDRGSSDRPRRNFGDRDNRGNSGNYGNSGSYGNSGNYGSYGNRNNRND
jgi:ATP-dependent RNA helicase DeaD